MPVYNARKCIAKPIDSIFSQTFLDWELIMIDDGSSDGTGDLLDKYAQGDSRIKVKHKENEGVAMARQMGVDMANGEYCIHVDADDWMEPTMLEELYNKAKADDADIVISDYYVNTIRKESLCKQEPKSLQPESILYDMFDNRLFGSLWHKLVRTELYKKYNARFFKGINHCEDLLIWVQLLQHADVKVSYLSKAFYHYCCNESSITRNFTRSTYEMRLRFYEKLKELLIIPKSEQILKKVSFDIFTEAFIYDVLITDEVRNGLRIYYSQITNLRSKKWKIGFFLLKYGYYRLAHKLIHY